MERGSGGLWLGLYGLDFVWLMRTWIARRPEGFFPFWEGGEGAEGRTLLFLKGIATHCSTHSLETVVTMNGSRASCPPLSIPARISQP